MRNKGVSEAYRLFRRRLAQEDPIKALAELQDPALPEWLRQGAEDAMWSWIFPWRHEDPKHRASSATIMRNVEKFETSEGVETWPRITSFPRAR